MTVWSTSMLFRPRCLGYVYAHWAHARLDARKQAIMHIAVLAARRRRGDPSHAGFSRLDRRLLEPVPHPEMKRPAAGQLAAGASLLAK